MTDAEKPNDADWGLLSVVHTLIEVMLAKGYATPKTFDVTLSPIRDAYLQKAMPHAAAIVERARLFATDPERAAGRERIRALLEEPPQGQA